MIAISNKIKDKLNILLKLPYREGMQDWDIELADPARVKEFCDFYGQQSGEEEKQALMALIIASFNVYLSGMGEHELWSQIAGLLKSDYHLHKPTLFYWSGNSQDGIDTICDEEFLEAFPATALIKKLIAECERIE